MPQRKPSPSIDVKAMRQRMGLSQTDLVEKIYGTRNRTHKRTIRAWEKKEQEPGPMARRHLERVQQEFDSQQGSKGSSKTEAPGATRVRGTRVPESTSSSSKGSDTNESRPVSRLAPGITTT